MLVGWIITIEMMALLVTYAGSLMNLAKHPSSTVQILGAEKALFRFVVCVCMYQYALCNVDRVDK